MKSKIKLSIKKVVTICKLKKREAMRKLIITKEFKTVELFLHKLNQKTILLNLSLVLYLEDLANPKIVLNLV